VVSEEAKLQLGVAAASMFCLQVRILLLSIFSQHKPEDELADAPFVNIQAKKSQYQRLIGEGTDSNDLGTTTATADKSSITASQSPI
jgi:hypothetical protein